MGGLGPGIGGSEWFIIGLVALLVVGPERLPGLLRQLGKIVAKARGMANEFRSSFDEMARQSELDDLRKEVEALRTGQPIRLGADADAAFKDIKSEFDKPLFDAPVMTPAASEWPDGEPVMMPIADAPLVAPELIEPVEADSVVGAQKPRKRAAKVAEPSNPIQAKARAAKASRAAPARSKAATAKPGYVKSTAEVREPVAPKPTARKSAPRNSKLDL